MPAKPIINCHTHIFTGDHVPPYLAKTFLPWPFYYLLPLSLIVRLFRFWYNYPYTWQFQPRYKKIQETFYRIKMFGSRYGINRFISGIFGIFLSIQVFFIVYDWLNDISNSEESLSSTIDDVRNWLDSYGLIMIPSSFAGKLLLVVFLILFFKWGRNIIFTIAKKLWSFLGVLPGPKSKELAKRYLNIGRFAFYTQQENILEKLKNQYPDDTGFVVLPMDMEYMDAGRLGQESRYFYQMQELKKIKEKDEYKNKIYPFVFADPRRIRNERETQLSYNISSGEVHLEKCFIKEFIEDYKFSGFKIYPALGYYPFDEALLPLWKYAADRGLPILTHCIRGIIYYRGNKEKGWDTHPVFRQASGNGNYDPLLLKETKNIDFINNFTHPLNYLCLLDEELLRKIVGNAKDHKLRLLFGYTDETTPMKYDLRHLKLCFGHFGGEDEWDRFIELDRDNYSSQIVKNPLMGITFQANENGDPRPGKIEQLWKYCDWYSIICSMILQYKNVYADISYILHVENIQPLLKQTLLNPILKKQVLYGTDFYVVRNHKTEKAMLAEMRGSLSEEEFDQIARINPEAFLKNNMHEK